MKNSTSFKLILLLFFFNLIYAAQTDAQTYTTAHSGIWGATATWVGGIVPPNGTDIIIANGHSVTANIDVTCKSITVKSEGTLIISNDAVTINTAACSVLGNLNATNALNTPGRLVSINLTINGFFMNSSNNAAAISAGHFTVYSGGTYTHNAVGSVANGLTTDFPGTISIVLGPLSNVIITKWATGGAANPVPLPATAYGNITINMPGITFSGNWQQNGALNNINNNLTLTNTGTGSTGHEFIFNNEINPSTLNVQGNMNINIPFINRVNLSGGSPGSSAVTVNIHGNFLLSGGFFNMGSGSTTTTLNLNGNFKSTDGQIISNNSATTNIVFGKPSGIQNFTQQPFTFSSPVKLNFGSGVSANSVQLNSDLANGFADILVAANCTLNGISYNMVNVGAINISGILNATGNITPGGTFIVPAGGTVNYSTGTITLKNINNNMDIWGTFKLGNGTILMATQMSPDVSLTVGTTGVMDLFTGIVNKGPYNCTFTAVNGSTLKIGSPNGISLLNPTGNVQTSTRNFNTGANYVYEGSINQVTGNGLPLSVKTLEIANTGSTGNNTLTLSSNVTVTQTLSMKTGVITTSSNKVIVTNTAFDAITHDSGNTSYTKSWINGNLQRFMASNASTYDFPVGNMYSAYLMQMLNNNSTGISYLNASYGAMPGTDYGFHAYELFNSHLVFYNSINKTGVWYLTPDAGYSGGANYSLRLYINTVNGLRDNKFAILSRPDASVDASQWIAPVGSKIPASGLPGRTVISGYAERNNITAFCQFGLGETDIPFRIISGSDSKNETAGMIIYPNPATDNVNIIMANQAGSAMQMIIKNAEGKIMSSTPVNSPKGDNAVTSDISTLDNGIYFITLLDNQNNTSSTQKFVKVK